MATIQPGTLDSRHKSCVVVLVKALPQPSKTHGETVCCAGVTVEREWKRLFPVRFRHLKGAHSFNRWDVVTFEYRPPTRDYRRESCHVFEDTIMRGEKLKAQERVRLLAPMMMPSAHAAAEAGHSLALIRPKNTRFRYSAKTEAEIEAERAAYQRAASQTSMFDRQLAEMKPSPFKFQFDFDDAAGRHTYTSGDWETHTTFWKWRECHGDEVALRMMSDVFNDDYPKRGMAFAIGNQAKRPKTWQLLGVIRLDEDRQGDLFG